mmetsp:Transcript_20688/g.33357  ORF Transcript_20688/g.33357 Transcript_20688/m.33357 type:complete len:548 (-) Transcript_20688:173-1816(-)
MGKEEKGEDKGGANRRKPPPLLAEAPPPLRATFADAKADMLPMFLLGTKPLPSFDEPTTEVVQLSDEKVDYTAAPPHWGKLLSDYPDDYQSFTHLERKGFGEQEFILGRGQVIPGHTLISSKQIRLYTEIAGDGAEQVWIENVGRNPIMVNNFAMEKGAKRMLENGSSIVIVQKKYKKKELEKEYPRISYRFYLPDRVDTCPLDLYRKVKPLGSGGEASVSLVLHRRTGKQYAMKEIRKKTVSDEKKLLQEMRVLSKLSHRNIIRVYDVFDTEQYVVLILEYVPDGDLFTEILREKNIISEKDACRYVGQMLNALEFLHTQNPRILHLDLKPENILFDKKSGQVKLADFGFSQYLKQDEEHVKLPVKGSEPYMSPEMTKEIYCPEGDLWSVGVVLYAMLAKQLPFGQRLPRSIMFEKIRKGKFGYGKRFQELHEEVKEGEKVIKVIRPAISDQAKEVINGLLTVDRDSRWTIQQVRNSKWVTGFGSPSFENSSSNGQGPSSKKRKPSIDSSTTSNTATTESRILSHEATSPKKQKTGTSAEGGESRA